MGKYSEKELLLVKRHIKTHLKRGQSLHSIGKELAKVGVEKKLIDASMKHRSYLWILWVALVIAYLAVIWYYFFR